MLKAPISRRYIIQPKKRRDEYVNKPHEGFFRGKAMVQPDRWKRYLSGGDYNVKDDGQFMLRYTIDKYADNIPHRIVIKPLPYNLWKLYRSFDNDPEAIAGMVSGAITDMSPDDIDILDIITRRPLFWKSLFEIIKSVSTRDHEQNEKLLADKVQKASERFNTLDGVYDLFVFSNYPEMYENYRKMDFFERIEMIALIQHVTNINMYDNLMAFRKGKTKYLLFKPLDKKAIINKEADEALKQHGFDRETIAESAIELREQIEIDKRNMTPRPIDTAAENTALMEADS
jgi:hypothetical protein